jgi:hypothetical protein
MLKFKPFLAKQSRISTQDNKTNAMKTSKYLLYLYANAPFAPQNSFCHTLPCKVWVCEKISLSPEV